MTSDISPMRVLSLLAAEAVKVAERLYHEDDTYEACQVLMASRVFKQAVDVFVIYREKSR